jgi:hypothetical protein
MDLETKSERCCGHDDPTQQLRLMASGEHGQNIVITHKLVLLINFSLSKRDLNLLSFFETSTVGQMLTVLK